jgi:hypothetical protein
MSDMTLAPSAAGPVRRSAPRACRSNGNEAATITTAAGRDVAHLAPSAAGPRSPSAPRACRSNGNQPATIGTAAGCTICRIADNAICSGRSKRFATLRPSGSGGVAGFSPIPSKPPESTLRRNR